MSRQDHLRAAARCYERARDDEAALRCHLAAGNHTHAAPLLERAGRPAEAAEAFARAGRAADAARCWELAGRLAEAAEAWIAANEPLRAAWLYAHELGRPATAEALLAATHTGPFAAETEQVVRLRLRPQRRGTASELLTLWLTLQNREATLERARLQDRCIALTRVLDRPDLLLRMHARADAATWDSITNALFARSLAPQTGLPPNRRSRPLYMAFENRWYEIDKDEFVIGRAQGLSGLSILDANIARRHCSVVRRGNDYFIHILDASGGIDFQGSQVRDNHKIDDGNVYLLGDHEIRFSFTPPNQAGHSDSETR